jgi:hypothetical protein
VSAADIDGWRVRELMMPLFMGDDEELQALTRDHLILPYLFGDFYPSHIQEYAGGLLIALEKPANPDGSPGGLRPIICGESWRRCLANLAAAAVRGTISNIHIRKFSANSRSPGWRFPLLAPPLRQDSFCHVCLTQR